MEGRAGTHPPTGTGTSPQDAACAEPPGSCVAGRGLELGPAGLLPPSGPHSHTRFPALSGWVPARGAGGRLGATSRPGPWPLCHAPHLVFPHSPGCGGPWGWTPKQEWRWSRGREGPDTLGTTCIGGSRATRSDWRRGRQQQARVGRASGPRSRLRRWARRLPREPAGL